MQPTAWSQPEITLSDSPAASGDFYVEEQECIACGAPAMEAPALMAHRPSSSCCFFLKQPTSSLELDQAVAAVEVSCCRAVRYRGSDPAILKRLSPESVDSPERHAHLIAIAGIVSLLTPKNDVRSILTTPQAGFFTRLFKRFK